MPLSAGVRFGQYEVVEHLGRGGMGEVYRARDARLRRDVALKVVREAHRFNPDTRARLEREAQALAAVNHPNIATVHGVEEADGIQALVMELVEGETLGHRVDTAGLRSVGALHGRSPVESRGRQGGGLPLGEALAIARQLTDALEAAHERGLIHRDLKPANIKLRPDGTVKVLDFGLAKALDVERGDGTAATATLTSEHIVRGTPSYMSPEQARGAAVDRRTDIWAFGCVLYEMLTGRRAFEGASSSDV